MATLKVNLSAVGNACDQDPTPAGKFPGPGWYVFLEDCHGNPFVKAGKEYGPIPVDHGYVEIKDVPPGRYILFAIVNPFPVGVPIPGGEVIYQANFASHFAIVDVCCPCDDICVTLYNSGWHYCVRVIVFWFQLLMMQKQLTPDLAQPVVDALGRALLTHQRTTPDLPTDAAVNKHIASIVDMFRQQQPPPPPPPRASEPSAKKGSKKGKK
jgi:hypothetical protein